MSLEPRRTKRTPSTISSGGAAAWAAQKIVTRQPRSTSPARHLLEVALGAAALGVAGVAPAQEDDVPVPARSVEGGHIAAHRYVSGYGRPRAPPTRCRRTPGGAPPCGGRCGCCASSGTSSPTPTGSTPRSPTTPSASSRTTSTWPGATCSTSAAGPATSATPSRRPGRRTSPWTPTSASSPGWARSRRGTVIGSGMQLPFRDDCLDVCYSSNVLEHVPDPWRMADEMVRVTRPGGIASSATPSGSAPGAATRPRPGTTWAAGGPAGATAARTATSRRTGSASRCSRSPSRTGCAGRARRTRADVVAAVPALQPAVVLLAAARAGACARW